MVLLPIVSFILSMLYIDVYEQIKMDMNIFKRIFGKKETSKPKELSIEEQYPYRFKVEKVKEPFKVESIDVEIRLISGKKIKFTKHGHERILYDRYSLIDGKIDYIFYTCSYSDPTHCHHINSLVIVNSVNTIKPTIPVIDFAREFKYNDANGQEILLNPHLIKDLKYSELYDAGHTIEVELNKLVPISIECETGDVTCSQS